MLDELTKTIDSLKTRIREHRDQIGAYEVRTRTALIDPMLRALGWDVSDPSLVTIEAKMVRGWADYALLDGNGEIVVLVEAKKLSDKDIPFVQIVSYAVSEQMQGKSDIRYCAITNGDVWHLYDLQTRKSLLETSIVSDKTAKCALQLLGLWRANMTGGRYSAAVQPVAPIQPPPDPPPSPPTTSGPSDPVQPAGWTAPPDPAPQSRQVRDEGRWSPLSEVTYSRKGDPEPAEMRFPDGSSVPVKAWYELMVEATRWLSNSNLLQSHHCPISVSRKRYLVSTTPYAPGGKPMRAPKKVNSLYVEVHYQAIQSIRNARTIIKRVGEIPAQFHVRLR